MGKEKGNEKELRIDNSGRSIKVDPFFGYDVEYATECLASYDKMEVKKTGTDSTETAYRLKVCNYPDGRQVIFCPEYLKDIVLKAVKDIKGISDKVIIDSSLNESSYMIAQQKPMPTGRMTPAFTETSVWFIPSSNRVMLPDRVYGHVTEKAVFENVILECRDINKQLQSKIIGAGVKHPEMDYRYRNALSLNLLTNKIVLEIGGNPVAYINYDEKTGKITQSVTEKARSLSFDTPHGKVSVAEALGSTEGVHETIGVIRQLVTNDDNVKKASVNLASYLKQESGVQQSLSQTKGQGFDRAEFGRG